MADVKYRKIPGLLPRLGGGLSVGGGGTSTIGTETVLGWFEEVCVDRLLKNLLMS